MAGSLNLLLLLAMWTVDIRGQPFVGGGTDGNTTINPQNTSETPQCWLVADNEFRDQLSVYLGGKSKLIEMTINLRGYPEDMLFHSLKDVYHPYNWIRSTRRQGRSLLTLGDDYKYKSMTTLSIGVVSLEIDVSDLPVRCMHGRNPEETLNIIRQSFFRNFIGPLGENNSTFGEEEHLCNMQIFKEGEFAKFQYRCCQLDSDGNMVCHDLPEDYWIAVLLYFIFGIEILILLYSPLFLPDSLYRQKYVAGQCYYHLPGAPKTLKVAMTQHPDQFGVVNRHKIVRQSELKGMKHVKAMLPNNDLIPGKIYEIKAQKVRISVKSRRLLDGVSVPVNLANLLLYGLKKLEPLKECCASGILGKFNPDYKRITWHQCLTKFAQFFLLILLATPWIIRAILYFAYEVAVIEDKRRVAKEMGLKPILPLVVLDPTAKTVFIPILITFIVDFILFFVISSSMKEMLKNVIRQCLRDMKEGFRVAILAWTAKLTVMPFQKCGIVGLVFFLPYLAIVFVIILFVALFIFSTICLSIRIVSGFIVEALMELMLLLSDLVSFYVEIFAYTFMGVIVNAGVILPFLTVLVMVVVYCKNTFSKVYQRYQSYHMIIHRQLMEKAKEGVIQVARQETLEQDNTTSIVQGETTTGEPVNVNPQTRLKNHQLQWKTFGMLVFLNTKGTPLMPKKFFYKTTELNHFGCPGPIYRNVCSAVWDFLKILLFLMFVFVVVMALGDTYQISTTNQLLATAAGSFVPFIFRYLSPKRSGVDDIDESSIEFQTELKKAIKEYTQFWPVFDIIPVSEVVNNRDIVPERAARSEVDIIIDASRNETRTVTALPPESYEMESRPLLERHEEDV